MCAFLETYIMWQFNVYPLLFVWESLFRKGQVEDFEHALQVDVLACSLRLDKDASGDLLEHLSAKLAQALPDECEITRGGWLLSSKKPVVELSVKLDDTGFQFTSDKRGVISARRQKIVRGVVLKSEDVEVEKLIGELAEKLASLAEKNARTREALQKFVVG